MQQTVLTRRGRAFGCRGAQTLTIDSSIDDDMGDMDALGAVLPSGALGDRAQSGLGGGESNERAAAAH